VHAAAGPQTDPGGSTACTILAAPDDAPLFGNGGPLPEIALDFVAGTVQAFDDVIADAELPAPPPLGSPPLARPRRLAAALLLVGLRLARRGPLRWRVGLGATR
jgi:hypothetical protein